MAELTPEQKAAEEVFEKAGLKDVMGGEPEVSKPVEEPPKEEKPPEVPKVEEPPAKKKIEVDPDEYEKLQDRAKWADREKERADRERDDRQRSENELTRLRTLPQPLQPTAKKERTEEEKKAREWLVENIKEMGAEILQYIPEEALSRHPAMAKRDMAIFLTRDQLEQQQFLGQFPQDKQEAVRKSILPELQQGKQASGWRKSYFELWDEKRKAVAETASLYGVVGAPPAPPQPPVQPVIPIQVPPTLAGVPGGVQPRVQEQKTPLSAEELRVFGAA